MHYFFSQRPFKPVSLLAALLLALAPARVSAAAPEPRPNIVVILADDMGYSDPGCYGGEMRTPAIDRLAREGLRLPRLQNGGMCVISRSCFLTGQWWPSMQTHFQRTELLPELLHASGYRTALVGKWHLPGDPMDRGFDHFFGFLGGFSDHFAGSADYRLDRQPYTRFPQGYYSSDAFSDDAVQFITRSSGSQPFFLYLSYQAPHNPLQAPAQDILKQRGRYGAGWQAVREARFERQKQMGLFPPETRLPSYPENLPAWDSLSPEQRDLEDLRMSTFAAMIERMDQGIGRVLQALDETGQAAQTLVLFCSDNGADPFSVADRTLLEQGKLPGDPHSNFQLGTGWAYASVTPWRLYKISQHAGGVTTGAVLRWARLAGERGRIDQTPLHFVDLLPTLLEVAGVPTPHGPSAGESFLPLLEGQPWRRKAPLFFQMHDNRAIRAAGWTLAEVDHAGWELFRADTDPLETNDLASNSPDVVADLERKWLEWWRNESGQATYSPKAAEGGHYVPQGDRGSGKLYTPSAMPARLRERYPSPAR